VLITASNRGLELLVSKLISEHYALGYGFLAHGFLAPLRIAGFAVVNGVHCANEYESRRDGSWLISLNGYLTRYRQIKISVVGRTSGHTISIPVWFVFEGERLYLLPVQGSDLRLPHFQHGTQVPEA
jgi:hypothetical protein